MPILLRAGFALPVAVVFVLLVGPATASFPGTNGKIAFASGRDGNVEIYVMNSDASGQTRITNDPGTDIDPAWSADGAAIAFTSNDDIWVMNGDGSGRTRLTSDSASDVNAAWSPDGTRIAFASTRDGNGEIYVMKVDGSSQTRLTTSSAPDSVPAWSPNGAKIAFASARDGNYDIYVMNADGSDQKPLTADPASDLDPNWSPDGSRIAFASNRDGNYELYVMSADGSGQTRLTRNLDTDLTPTWSPDGKSIAFTTNRDGNLEIYAMNQDGTGQSRLTTNAADDTTPDWESLPIQVLPQAVKTARFDGQWRESLYYGVLVISGDTPGPARLQYALRQGSRVYLSGAVSPPGGPFAFRFPLPRTLFPGAYVLGITAVDSPTALAPQQIPVTLASPPEGVVRKAWASTSAGGLPVSRFPPTTSIAWANFQFATLPRAGREITVAWYYGAKSQLIGVATIRRRPLVYSWVGTTNGAPLRRGTREAVLRAGKTVVKRLRFRIH